MKRILIFTFSLLFEDCIFSINSIFYTPKIRNYHPIHD